MGCSQSLVDKGYLFVAEPSANGPRCSWIALPGAAASRPARGSASSHGSAPPSSRLRSSSRRVQPGPESLRRLGGSVRGLRTRSQRPTVGRSGRRRRSDEARPQSKYGSPASSSSSQAWATGRGVSDATSPKEFTLLRLLGRGTLGRVFLAKHKSSGKYYAIKRIAKGEVCKRRNIKGVLAEIDILRAARHPFIVHMFAALQDNRYIYIVLSYAVGGEIYARMGRPFCEDSAKFYMAEVFLAIQHLHRNMTTAFRDLKPENILIDQNGHVSLVDFGFAVKLSGEDHELPKSCGTTQYMAPELIQKKRKHGMAVDWWAAGCVMFEILTGRAPFGDIGDKSKWEIYSKAANGKFKFPSFVSKPARELITQLLQPDPSKRAKWDSIKRCTWFRGIDWEAVAERRVTPPFLPNVEEEGTCEYYPERPDKKEKSNVLVDRDELMYSDITQARQK